MADIPYPVFDAIQMALSFLSFEELPPDERPPRHIWLQHEAMEEHWERVKAIRDRKYSGGDYYDDHDIEDPVQSELTEGLRERLMHG